MAVDKDTVMNQVTAEMNRIIGILVQFIDIELPIRLLKSAYNPQTASFLVSELRLQAKGDSLTPSILQRIRERYISQKWNVEHKTDQHGESLIFS